MSKAEDISSALLLCLCQFVSGIEDFVCRLQAVDGGAVEFMDAVVAFTGFRGHGHGHGSGVAGGAHGVQNFFELSEGFLLAGLHGKELGRRQGRCFLRALAFR